MLVVTLTINSFAQDKIEIQALAPGVQHLISTLQKDQKANRVWWGTWLGLYSTATVVQTGIALSTDNKALRQDMYLGAATTVLGAGFQLLTPYVKINLTQFENFEALSPENQMVLIKQAEDYFKQSAQYEKEIRSWKNHALTTAANLGSGLITWLAFDRTFKDGVINFAINTVITETQIWTQPILAKKEWEKIKSGNISANSPSYTLSAYATMGGIQLKLVF